MVAIGNLKCYKFKWMLQTMWSLWCQYNMFQTLFSDPCYCSNSWNPKSLFSIHQRPKRCSANKSVYCQVKVNCSYINACFGFLVALVGCLIDGSLGKFHHICKGEYKGAKGIVYHDGEKNLFRVCVYDILTNQL